MTGASVQGQTDADQAGVTFVALFSMLGRVHADVAGHPLEGLLAAAGAVAADTVKTLRTETHGSAALVLRWPFPVVSPHHQHNPHLSSVVAGMLESAYAGFTVWAVEALTAPRHLRHTPE